MPCRDPHFREIPISLPERRPGGHRIRNGKEVCGHAIEQNVPEGRAHPEEYAPGYHPVLDRGNMGTVRVEQLEWLSGA